MALYVLSQLSSKEFWERAQRAEDAYPARELENGAARTRHTWGFRLTSSFVQGTKPCWASSRPFRSFLGTSATTAGACWNAHTLGCSTLLKTPQLASCFHCQGHLCICCDCRKYVCMPCRSSLLLRRCCQSQSEKASESPRKSLHCRSCSPVQTGGNQDLLQKPSSLG